MAESPGAEVKKCARVNFWARCACRVGKSLIFGESCVWGFGLAGFICAALGQKAQRVHACAQVRGCFGGPLRQGVYTWREQLGGKGQPVFDPRPSRELWLWIWVSALGEREVGGGLLSVFGMSSLGPGLSGF